MRLVRVRSLSQRPASNLSVIVQFLFGTTMPGEFQPGHEYKKGDTVYTISEDGLTIKLWTCNIGGAYSNTKEPYWTEFSLSSYLNERLSKIVKAIYNPHPQMYNLGQQLKTRILTNMGDSLEHLENTPSYMDLFYEGNLIPPNTYTVEDGMIRDNINLDMELDKLSMDVYTPSHELARLIRRVSFISYMNQNREIEIPCRKIHDYVSYGYELTINGTFIPPDFYTERIASNGNITLQLHEGILEEGWINSYDLSTQTNLALNSMVTDASYERPNKTNDASCVIDGLTDTYWESGVMSVPIGDNKPDPEYLILELPINKPSIVATKISISFKDEFWASILRVETSSDGQTWEQTNYNRHTSGLETNLTVNFEGIITLKKYVRFKFEELNVTAVGERRLRVREIQIIGPSESSTNAMPTCVANFMVSVSDNINIVHSTLSKTIEHEMDSYDIDITDSGYINVFQTMSIYINGKRVDSSMFHFSKGFLNVKEKENYLKIGDTITVSVMTFIPNKFIYVDVNHENRRYITESVYTVENNTRLVPIPFMEFNEDLDDFIVFNENGALISSAKYYIDNDYIRYYSHDQGTYIGDTLNFKMIDRNQNTTMRTFILNALSENQTSFELPFNSDDYAFKMVFYSVGAYISPNEYTMQGYRLDLTHDMSLDIGDRIEIIAFKYPGEIGSTVMSYQRIFVDQEIQNTFKLDFQFDPSVTSFLIFANTGLYIGEKFYTISHDNVLTIKGEEVYNGGWLDIVVVQSTEALTSADNILDLL